MALRDYYQEGAEDAEAAAAAGKKRNPDDWALAYLNVSRLQSISEAFDDDARYSALYLLYICIHMNILFDKAGLSLLQKPTNSQRRARLAGLCRIGCVWSRICFSLLKRFRLQFACWAVGFHQSMSIYATKIRELIAKMFALRTLVLPANRTGVNAYLEGKTYTACRYRPLTCSP
jgi:hypothetical protein